MSYTYDVTTEIGKVRLYGQDHPDSGSEDDALFSDEEVQVFLDDNDDDVLYAAASLLERTADSQTLLLKKLTLGGGALITDGPAVAEDLRKSADRLRALANESGDWTELIDFAEWNVLGNYRTLIRTSR